MAPRFRWPSLGDFLREAPTAIWEVITSRTFLFMLGVVVGSVGAAYVLTLMLILRLGDAG